MNSPAVTGFLERQKAGRFWAYLLLVITAIFAVICFRLIEAFETRPRMLVIGPDTYFFAKEVDFTQARSLHIEQAELAAQALFNRNTRGFDHERRLKLLFNEPTYEKAYELLTAETVEFQTKSLSQKLEIQETKILRLQDRSVHTIVTGQLIRTGVFENRPVVEVLLVEVDLHFFNNPAPLHNGRYPTIVKDFTITLSPVSSL